MLQSNLDQRKLIDPRLNAAANLILHIQRDTGAISWFEDGIWDAWNHVECAMALEAFGLQEASDAAFDFLMQTQSNDGSWLGEFGNTAPMIDRLYLSRKTDSRFKDSNFIAYCAVGIWHRYLSREDVSDLAYFWPMVRRAIDFVLTLQSSHGEFSWSKEGLDFGPDDALRTGNASIRKSLECAIKCAETLGDLDTAFRYRIALVRLTWAFRNHSERFDRQGQSRDGFAMDWYYPVLSGVVKCSQAEEHIRNGWDKFILPELGCHCVLGEPWCTVAESAELSLTLTSVGAQTIARELLEQQFQHRDSDGCFWMGYQYDEGIFWPREKPSWTQAAMILAADALNNPNSATASLFRLNR